MVAFRRAPLGEGNVMKDLNRSRRLVTASVAALAVIAGSITTATSLSASTGPDIELTAVVPTLGDKAGPAYTYVPGGGATFRLTSAPGGARQWYWRALGSCVGGRGVVAGATLIDEATGDRYATGALADNVNEFRSYFVTVDGVASNCIDLLPNQVAVLPTPAPPPGLSGAGINQSVFIALPNTVPANTSFSATATFNPGGGAKTVSVNVFVLPTNGTNGITGQENASVTLWVPLPNDALGEVDVNISWPGGPGGGVTVRTTIAPEANASISVVQDAVGSRNITVTATTPRFTGTPVPADAYSTSFHVFDADTGAWIDPGRSGVLKSFVTIGGAEFLRSVDPLVLPASALGRRIRVGFVTYYFAKGAQAFAVPVATTTQFGALSDPITMQAGGGGGGGESGDGGDTPQPSPPAPAPAPAPTPAPAPEPAPTPAPAPAPEPVAPDLGNPAQVTPAQLEAIPPEQLRLVPPAEFGQIDPAAFAALTPQQTAALTPSQVNAIRPARAAQLSTDAVAALSPTQVAALRPASVRALQPQAVVALSSEQVAALRPAAVARIQPETLSEMSVTQLRSLTPRQVRALTPAQRSALSPQQIRALRR
jgi:hypothetical protein